jgi:hypothetical protein
MDPDFIPKVRADTAIFMDERLGPPIAGDARRYAPVGESTPATPRKAPHEAGELKASITHYMEGEVLIVEAAAPYAAYIEMGTFPHIIRAQGPWSLHNVLTDQYWGRPVHHPGNRPEPYLRPALYRYRTV